jgi:RNA polymerase sigma factor (sigma-70 family)
MAINQNPILDYLHRVLNPAGEVGLTDGQLLARFIASRDETAFAALVRRHGPMVWRLCRRVLGHVQDTEDAFQATFLILARKATAVVKRESVGSFLYGVAYRIAREAKAINDKRRSREKQVEVMPHPIVIPTEEQDWRPWLDHELTLLPEHYRAVIVACDLEGRSRKEAAHQLGLSEGTLSSRLARGRSLLAKRLSRYGLSLSVGALTATLTEDTASAHVSISLLSSTTQAAVGQVVLSHSIDYLVKGALKTMLWAKLKLTVGAVVVMVALGTSGLVYRASGQSAPTVTENKFSGRPRSELEALRRENELLKLNLEVVLEKVRAQEEELRRLKAQAGKTSGVTTAEIHRESGTPSTEALIRVRYPKTASNEIHLRGLTTGKKPETKTAPQNAKVDNKQELQRTVDALEKALKELREQLKKQEAAPPGK